MKKVIERLEMFRGKAECTQIFTAFSGKAECTQIFTLLGGAAGKTDKHLSPGQPDSAGKRDIARTCNHYPKQHVPFHILRSPLPHMRSMNRGSFHM